MMRLSTASLTTALHHSRPHLSRYMGTASTASTITTTRAPPPKKPGDISNAFVSLSQGATEPLPPRFATLKAHLIAGHESAVAASWPRLLAALAHEIPLIAAAGPDIIPVIDFTQLDDPPADFLREHRKRGVAVVRNVVPGAEALRYKADLRDYIACNPQTRAFPQDDPQVYELYWSRSQVRARAHPNLLKTQRFLMGLWHSKDFEAEISTQHPVSYADRLRMRMPGDSRFALGPHVDGGSVERWEEDGYGRGKVYDAIWKGRWEEYDPFEASSRLPVQSDLYQGVGACSMFRMYQGWLSLSSTGPHEGTLLVNPLLKLSTAYFLLRPFFTPITPSSAFPSANDPAFLSPSNWALQTPTTTTSTLHGATPGHGQELSPTSHPHLSLATSTIHIPHVHPGDYVAWHCDTVHAVDRIHAGAADASVLYIPTCPLTAANAAYLARQRAAWVDGGLPGPDFGGGDGERGFVGRCTVEEVVDEGWGEVGMEGRRAVGLEAWDAEADGVGREVGGVLHRANKILGFYG